MSEKYPLLFDRADLISVLYNQYNDFPITEQVYNMVWRWANRMVEDDRKNWMKEYWSYANQYYSFKLENQNDYPTMELFREFHVMIGAMLTYKRKFELLGYITQFTNSLPARYPLIPSTFSQIFDFYEKISMKNQRMYLLKYRMIGMYTGAGEENKIEGTLIDYLSLLFIRLYAVNDYNITFSNPLEAPPVGETVESNERKKAIVDLFINRIERWQLNPKELKACGIPVEGIEMAIDVLKKYRIACGNRQIEIPEHPVISEQKREWIKNDLIVAANNARIGLPFNGPAEDEGVEFTSSQEVSLDKRLILEGYDTIATNLGEALVNAIYTQLRQFYCYQFLLNSPCVSYTIPYRDMGNAMKRLQLNKNFSILALGVSSHFFDETEGFRRTAEQSLKYGEVEVTNIPANNNCLLVMKKEMVPHVVVRPISHKRKQDYNDEQEIEHEKRLYSNIDSMTPEKLMLTASSTFGILIPEGMKYLRVCIAYQLASDEILVRRVEPISKFIV